MCAASVASVGLKGALHRKPSSREFGARRLETKLSEPSILTKRLEHVNRRLLRTEPSRPAARTRDAKTQRRPATPRGGWGHHTRVPRTLSRSKLCRPAERARARQTRQPNRRHFHVSRQSLRHGAMILDVTVLMDARRRRTAGDRQPLCVRLLGLHLGKRPAWDWVSYQSFPHLWKRLWKILRFHRPAAFRGRKDALPRGAKGRKRLWQRLSSGLDARRGLISIRMRGESSGSCS